MLHSVTEFCRAAATDQACEKQEWVSKRSSRIWRGPLASKCWRYLADGAWVPRQQPKGRSSRGAGRSSASRARAPTLGRSTGQYSPRLPR